ncbi:transposase [Geodermatophilus sp. URMC 63]
MLPTEDLLVHVYVLVDDAIAAGKVTIPTRPGPTPACSDAELLTIALVRHLLGRRSEAGFLAEVARDFAHLFPRLPHQSQANRRIRWLWAAFEQLRAALVARCLLDDCAQIDTSALPVKHPSRVRGPDGWVGPGELVARFGRDGAHGEWFYGFRLAVRTDLGSRLVRAWSIVPAAVNERDVATELLTAGPAPRDLLVDKGFTGRACTARLRRRWHRRAHPAHQGPAPEHAQRAAPGDRLLAQPRRGHLRRAHRPDGAGPPRRPHLLGPADPHRRHHRRAHPVTRSPRRPRGCIGQPT